MIKRKATRLEKRGVLLWLRGLGVAVALGILTINTLRWVPHSVRVYATLAFLWILGLLALLFLARRWRDMAPQ